jgi:hypothetical protein
MFCYFDIWKTKSLMLSGGYCGFLLPAVKSPMFSLSVTCNDTCGICLAVWLAITNIKMTYLYSNCTHHWVNMDTADFTFTVPVLHTIYFSLTTITPTKCTLLSLKAPDITICSFCLIFCPYMFQLAWVIFRGLNASAWLKLLLITIY